MFAINRRCLATIAASGFLLNWVFKNSDQWPLRPGNNRPLCKHPLTIPQKKLTIVKQHFLADYTPSLQVPCKKSNIVIWESGRAYKL